MPPNDGTESSRDDSSRGVFEPGATWTGEGVRFAVFSKHATAVEVCLFDRPGQVRESRRLALERGADDVWRAEVPGLGPGQLYGYRVRGPYALRRGHRFNPAKLLIDPYARAVTGEPLFEPSVYGSGPGASPLAYDGRDSAGAMPKCVVVDAAFDWQGVRPPQVPWEETVLYECHVRGLTRTHPEVPPEIRGTYLGLAHPAVLRHLQDLGVTAVELLPVHQPASERHLREKGLGNYWGYSTAAYFAPRASYATCALGAQVAEFRTMVRELHRAGIEVILDVVYNHTAEGGADGPTLSLRGVDNASYYLLAEHDASRYLDFTGCGNTLDVRKGAVRRLILDSLRYWVEEMGVDGFRFDLATSLGRAGARFDPESEMLRAIEDDPVLARAKKIVEPWDLGPDGYQPDGFPASWASWDDRFRDTVRSFWRLDAGAGRPLAERLAGPHPSVGRSRRTVCFVTCHDGFTLADLVSYERKHNEANLEDNRDGSDHNLSRNWGVEGPTDDPEIRARRSRMARNILATLWLANGVPMICAGDELGRSQGGNNNAYCQDGPVSWLSWSPDPAAAELLTFCRRHGGLRWPASTAERTEPAESAAMLPGLLANPPQGMDEEPASFCVLRRRGGQERALLVNGSFSEVRFPGLGRLEDWSLLLATGKPPSQVSGGRGAVLEPLSVALLERPSRA